MKPLPTIILGCLPLAALTGWSFVELAAVNRGSGESAGPADTVACAAEADAALREAAADKPPADELLAADLLAGPPSAALANLPAESHFRSVAASWPQWASAREMLDAYLAVERQSDTTDPGRLNDLVRQLQDLKTRSKDAPMQAGAELATLVDRRIADLRQKVDRGNRLSEADALIARARQAFGQSQYGPCTAACDELLAKYGAVLDAATLDKAKLLRRRARFWDDNARLAAAVKGQSTPADRKAAVESFLGRYADGKDRTADELKAVQQWERLRDEADQRLRMDRVNREASQALRELEQSPPRKLEDRLRRAAKLAAQYPTDDVRRVLRAGVGRWLSEALPEKRLEEPKLIQEAATPRGEIVRGFFKEVKTADGKVVGYKRYPTYEEYLDPVAEVGTYRVQDLAGPPGESTPRSLAAQYREGLARLMEEPGRRQAWSDFASLCETLEGRRREYHKRAGASREEITFAPEARLAREILSGPAMKDLETIVGP